MKAMRLICVAAMLTTAFANADEIPSRKLLDAMAAVESSMGRTSGNIYQITPEYVADVNRILRKMSRVDGSPRKRYTCSDVFDKGRSEEMMRVFWGYYSKRLQDPSEENFAKIHNVGFRGLKRHRKAAETYWSKVMKQIKLR